VAPVGARTVRGAAWTILFATLGKGVTAAAQVALAWLLLPQDFGLAALALSCVTIATVISGSAWRNLLVQSPRKFEEIAGQVFWLALAAGVAVAAALALIAPLAGQLLRQPRLPGLIMVAALAAPLQALTTVYAARLARTLRFRDLARITFLAGLLQNATAVTLAALGLGPYALLIPLSMLAAVQLLGVRLAAGPVAVGRPEAGAWPALAKPALGLIAYALFTTLQVYGPNLVVGLVHRDPATTGYYYWGFVVASQAVFLLATNLQGVFFPAFSQLNGEPARQFQAVQRSLQALLVCVAPLCVLQALLAPPVIELLFHDRWLPTVPVVQWISLALATQPIGLVANATLMARGRFSALAGVAAVSAAATTLGGAAGALVGDQVQIAQGVAAGLLIGNAWAGWRASREFALRCMPVSKPVLMLVTALAVGITGAGWVCERLVPGSPLLSLAALALGGLVIYGVALRLWVPHVTAEIWTRLRLWLQPRRCS
jgi:PST family polysaccharide transporter